MPLPGDTGTGGQISAGVGSWSDQLDSDTGIPHDTDGISRRQVKVAHHRNPNLAGCLRCGLVDPSKWNQRCRSLKHDTFFRQHPVFTGYELARHLVRIGSNGARTQEKVLGYHTKAGRLRRIRQGMYAVIPPGLDGDAYPVDPYLVAAKLTPDAVLSHHTALEFHGQAYSVWQHFTYSAERPAETLTFRDQVFRGTKFPQALVRSGAEYRGVLTMERFGMLLRVTSLERTLVDVLDRPDLAGGWEEGLAFAGSSGVLRYR